MPHRKQRGIKFCSAVQPPDERYRKEDSMINTTAEAKTHLNVKQLTLVGLMTAIICIVGPFALYIPVSPVPISLGTLAIYFVVTVLGLKLGTLSVMVYILLGLTGIPIFTGYVGGPEKLLGPTGGYIIGYIFLTLIHGYCIDQWKGRLLPCIIGSVLGTAVLYLFGSLWLAFQAGYTLPQALLVGAIPYIPGDVIKIILAVSIGRQVRKRLIKTGAVGQ